VGEDKGNLLKMILGNPVLLLLYLPILPFLILAYSIPSQVSNVEEWVVRENPETGEIKVTVHRKVKRMNEVG